MGRKERRTMQKAIKQTVPRSMLLTKEQRIEALVKNGITPRDLEKEYERGFKAGFREAAPATFKAVYAAVCVALHDLHGFGHDRCAKVLMAVDDIVVNALTSEEIIEEVWQKIGLRLNFGEPFDRIEEASK